MASRNGSQAGRGVADGKIVSGGVHTLGVASFYVQISLNPMFHAKQNTKRLEVGQGALQIQKAHLELQYVGIAGITKRSTPRGFHNRFVPVCQPHCSITPAVGLRPTTWQALPPPISSGKLVFAGFCPRITLNATTVLCIRKTGISK